MGLRRRGRGRRLRWNHNGGWRTCHRLRGDESWRRFSRLRRNCRLGAGHGGIRNRRGSRRNSRGGSNGRPSWAGRGLTRGHNRTPRCGRLGGLLGDGLQHIPRLGNVRQVNLGLELIGRCWGARTAAAARLMLGKILFNALGFIFFDGTGVRFLLGYADLKKNVENRLALDLELSRQIIDSNLMLHSALFPPLCPVWLRVHSIPHGLGFCRPAATAADRLTLTFFARLLFLGNSLVLGGRPLMNSQLSFIGERRILHAIHHLGLVVLTFFHQFLDALRVRFRLFGQALDIA